MPRDGSGVAAPPASSAAVSGTTISSTKYNALVTDIYSVLNTILPVGFGGTGQTSIEGFRTAYSIYSKAETDTKLTGYFAKADPVDPTKIAAFNFSGITTGTTRTYTWPNASGIVMLADLYPTANSLDGLFLFSGDMLYATGENALARLAKGTDGQILKIGASAPSWIDDSALVRIASQTASGAGIAFTGLAGYAYIEIVFDSVIFSGVNDPYIRLSTDNGATYVSAAGSYDGVAANDATGTDSDTEIHLFDGATIGALDGRICLSFFNNATEKTVVDGSTRVGTLMCVVSARRNVAEINNAVSFFASTGTMSSGTVTLWGRKR